MLRKKYYKIADGTPVTGITPGPQVAVIDMTFK